MSFAVPMDLARNVMEQILKAGRINRQPVANAQEAAAAIRKASDRRLILIVWSQGGSRFVVVDGRKGK